MHRLILAYKHWRTKVFFIKRVKVIYNQARLIYPDDPHRALWLAMLMLVVGITQAQTLVGNEGADNPYHGRDGFSGEQPNSTVH